MELVLYCEKASKVLFHANLINLFVRPSNSIAINMYNKFSYSNYRRVIKYYEDGEEGQEMRKSLSSNPDEAIIQEQPPILYSEMEDGEDG